MPKSKRSTKTQQRRKKARRDKRRQSNATSNRTKKKVRPEVKYDPEKDAYFRVYSDGRTKRIKDRTVIDLLDAARESRDA